MGHEKLPDLGLVGEEGNETNDWIVVGRLIVDRNLNRAGVMAILRNIWPEKEAPAIGEVGQNTYSIYFVSEELILKALEGNPWSIMGHYLNLKKWEANTTVAELDFRVFRRLNLKRAEQEEIENQRSAKRAKSSVIIEEFMEEHGHFIYDPNSFYRDYKGPKRETW
ncbi:hypothetical protein CCACVL1_09457 [Corchorus capsularis]|uniref:DUF4283 domain-containing protein n=1 Tax=Corchorus capsularis TaxID=210143 RepID=A0A1R3IW19_COCAP|nr:hypothetical protein CCACVL1_09457 [Corchorus capsularis]